MSALVTMKLGSIRDLRLLKRAIELLSGTAFVDSFVEEDAVPTGRYAGREMEKLGTAPIVIRKLSHGGWADVAFRFSADGASLELFMDDMDEQRAAHAMQVPTGDKMVDCLAQYYAAAVAAERLQADGYSAEVSYNKETREVEVMAEMYA